MSLLLILFKLNLPALIKISEIFIFILIIPGKKHINIVISITSKTNINLRLSLINSEGFSIGNNKFLNNFPFSVKYAVLKTIPIGLSY